MAPFPLAVLQLSHITAGIGILDRRFEPLDVSVVRPVTLKHPKDLRAVVLGLDRLDPFYWRVERGL